MNEQPERTSGEPDGKPAGSGSRSAEAITVKLERSAYGGKAIGRLPDGKTVFVPFGLAGETVVLLLTEERPRFARGRILEILQASPQRIAARCKHFGACGGCHYQHLAYPAQLELKTELVREQLQRVGGLSAPNVLPAVPSPLEWRYRNHVQFHLRPPADGQEGFCRLGFIGISNEDVLPLEECHLPVAAIDALWRQIELEPVEGLAGVSFRAGADDDMMVILESDSPEAPEMELDLPVSVAHLSEWGALLMAGSPDVTMQVKERLFRVSAGSFFQVNTGMAEKLVEHLLEILPLTKTSRVLDVYCGVGLFSAFIAPLVQQVIGIEESPAACADFEVNLDEFENVSLYEAPAEEVLAAADWQADVVIVDPPRAGLAKAALQGILKMRPGTVVYVSCDPATLGRDLKHFVQGGYAVRQVTPFDMFPQTYHVESVVLMTKCGSEDK